VLLYINRSFERIIKPVTKLEILYSILLFGNIFYLIIVCIIMYFGGLKVLNGNITTGALIALITYLGYLSEPIQTVVNNYGTIKTIKASETRINNVYNKAERDQGFRKINPLLPINIIFEDVNLKKNGRVILKDINFCVQSNEFVGIVGKNGSGKSTLFNLITKLEYLSSGNIEIQDINLKDLTYESLYENVKYVFQENEFIKGTIMDNLFFEPYENIDINYIEWLFNKFDMPFLRNDFYSFQINEDGNNLSGGQKQRLAIIRALVFNPPILLLDEITSSLDKETEKKVLKTIKELRKGKITLFISHRLENFIDADKIIRLDNGTVTEISLNDRLTKLK